MTDDEIAKSIAGQGKDYMAAIKLLYEVRLRAIVRGMAYQYISQEEAQDLLQEAIIKIIKGAPSYKGTSPAVATAWFKQVTRNCMMDYLRKQGRIHKEEIAIDIDDTQWAEILNQASKNNEPQYSDFDDRLEAVMDKFRLIEPERHLPSMLQSQQKSIIEIAEAIGRSVNATKEYISQCKKKLKNYMAPCAELLAS